MGSSSVNNKRNNVLIETSSTPGIHQTVEVVCDLLRWILSSSARTNRACRLVVFLAPLAGAIAVILYIVAGRGA